jgi:hypothetical protein
MDLTLLEYPLEFQTHLPQANPFARPAINHLPMNASSLSSSPLLQQKVFSSSIIIKVRLCNLHPIDLLRSLSKYSSRPLSEPFGEPNPVICVIPRFKRLQHDSYDTPYDNRTTQRQLSPTQPNPHSPLSSKLILQFTSQIPKT